MSEFAYWLHIQFLLDCELRIASAIRAFSYQRLFGCHDFTGAYRGRLRALEGDSGTEAPFRDSESA